MEARRWEDLNTDCLIMVFEKVGLGSLILDIPFVCKSWYKASLDPLIYKVLHFELIPESSRWATTRLSDKTMAKRKYSHLPPSIQFIKVAVNRSCGMATKVVFPTYPGSYVFEFENLFHISALEYVFERCPALKTLIVPYFNFYPPGKKADECLVKMISKLKHLESLATLTFNFPFSRDILNQIHIHCQNFQSLTVRGNISNDITSDIVTLFPNIKHLVLQNSILYHRNLVRILSGCSKVELLDVTYCRGFDGDDATILKLASHISIFNSEGSVLLNYADVSSSDDGSADDKDEDYNSYDSDFSFV